MRSTKNILVALMAVSLCTLPPAMLAAPRQVRASQLETIVGPHANGSPLPAGERDRVRGVKGTLPSYSPHLNLLPMGEKELEVDKPRLAHAYGQLPLYFIENKGQVDTRVKYYEKGAGHATFFTADGVHLVLTKPTSVVDVQWHVASSPWSVVRGPLPTRGLRDNLRLRDSAPRTSHSVTLHPVGMNTAVEVVAQQPQAGKVNYFVGNDPTKWQTDVPTYGTVVYKEAYPSVDLKFYGNNRQMEYDVIVRPGADPTAVRFEMSGVEGLEVGAGGELQVHLPDGGKLEHKKPYVYQEIDGKKVEIAGNYKLHGKSAYSFEVGAYDRDHALVIDPVFGYSTYLGGSGWDQAEALALDAAGQVYVTGFTSSLDFPVVNAVDSGGDFQVFVTKLNAAGTTLLYSTYLGGGAIDEGNDIAVDGSGNAYVTGTTHSPDFPTTPGAFDTTYDSGGSFPSDAFVTKLGVTGALLYSTYLGGNNGDGGSDIVVDGFGNAYVVGGTISTNFPVQNPLQGGLQGSFADVFITKFNAAGSALLYSTYLGGSGQDHGDGIATDTAGNVYITGFTQSTNFPLLNPFDNTLTGPMDVFIAKFSTVGGFPSYSTYLGGSGFDEGHDIVVDAAGNAYVTGETSSGDFPTVNALDSTPNGGVDAFITKLNALGSGLVYSTYLGGGDHDIASDIALDGSGSVYVVGWTRSPNFPLANELDDTLESFDGFDAFIARLNAASGALLYSTYLGGDNHDLGLGLAADTSSNVYVTGVTESPNFPTTPGAFDVAPNGQEEVFITKIGLGAELIVNTLNDDTTNGDGLCTLREAIMAVNNNVNFNDCTNTGGFGKDTITFSVSGMITLTSALPAISDPLGLTIDGENNGVTVSGADLVRVFEVAIGAGLDLRNLTIADGAAGEGGGLVTAQNSTVRVTNATFVDNSAGDGGGIFNRNGATLTVTNSTFSGNSAGNSGGAIFNFGTLTVIHSTVAGNSAAFGGGGIANIGTATVSNTILANNTGGSCAGNMIGDGGFNIDSGATCGFIALSGSQSNTDPLLDPIGLQDNGGPTPTIALCQGTDTPSVGCTGLSPALDLIPNGTFGCGTTIKTDQRGVGRPVDGDTNGQADCDIGAYELDADADGDGVTVGEGDCNDADPTVNPGATEVCDFVDNDCDGQIDEGLQGIFYEDSDSDTFGNPSVQAIACTAPTGFVTNNTDCDDTNAAIHPGATEVCNGVDDDCDGSPDESPTDPMQPLTQSCYTGPMGTDGVGLCQDGTQTCTGGSFASCMGEVVPTTEVCGDGIDQDCNGSDLACPPPEVCGNCVDDDGDGKTDLADSDCPMTASATVKRGTLSFAPDADEDRLTLNLTFVRMGITIDPPMEGVTLSLFDANGTVACVPIPAGAGWTMNKPETRWSFKDPRGILGPSGKELLTIQCNPKQEVCTLSANIRETNLTGNAMTRSLTTGVVINNDRLESAQVWRSLNKGKRLVTP